MTFKIYSERKVIKLKIRYKIRKMKRSNNKRGDLNYFRAFPGFSSKVINFLGTFLPFSF
jgi:hypothetical protein